MVLMKILDHQKKSLLHLNFYDNADNNYLFVNEKEIF